MNWVAENTLEEVSRFRWPIKVGDMLLFTEGNSDLMRFSAYAGVIKVDSFIEGIDDEHNEVLYVTRVTISESTPLPQDRTLENYMFSLVRIANFGRPHLHLRHRSKVDPIDLETIVQGRIDSERTLYFGLLRELPASWRMYFEHSSVARSAFRRRADYPQGLPVEELILLLKSIVLQSIDIAMAIEPFTRRVFENMDEPSFQIEAVGSEELRTSPWNVSRLLREAESLSGKIREDWDVVEMLQEDAKTLSTPHGRGEPKWRPHKW